MPNHESPPLLAGELRALARDQLKMQTARSTALETGGLGAMAVPPPQCAAQTHHTQTALRLI
jgi:hypothetical protein